MFSLNATMPVFLLMVLGYALRRGTRLLSGGLVDGLNRFVFQMTLPVQLFQNLAQSDFHAVWDGSVVLFCFLASLLSILAMAALSLLVKERTLRGEFIQAGYRGSQALLGVALMQNIFGSTGPLPLIIIGAVPLYNVAAVVILTLTGPGSGRLDRSTLKKTALGIARNPIILGILAGLAWSLLSIPQPVIFQRAVASLSATASPLGLIALGASVDLKKAAGYWRPTLLCSLCKLVVFPAAFLPIAVALGYRNGLLVAVLVMLGSPTTVSCFTMAKNMGHEGLLSSGAVMLTTMCSAFSFTAWLYLLRSLALL